MNENMKWAKAHVEEVRQFAEDSFAKRGRGAVEVELSGEDATYSYCLAQELDEHGVGKFGIALHAMVKSSDPIQNATLVIRRNAEVMGCGMIEAGRITGWCRHSDSLIYD